MANDVSIKVSGIPITPIGVDITYAVNAVPQCLISMDATASAILQDPDSYKRQGLVTVTVKVKDHSMQFVGYFDGLSASQSVGGINYTAVLKGQAQLLLESDTILPGLSAYGQNPFKIFDPLQLQTTDDSASAIVNLVIGPTTITLTGASFAEAYKQVAIAALTYQSTAGYEALVLKDTTTGLNAGGLKDILENPGRRTKMGKALTYLNNLDVSSLASLQNILNPGDNFNAKGLINTYVHGPRMLWQNMVDFYGMLGAILIPANNSIIVVPNNGFITFPHDTPGVGQHSNIINAAYPADYNSFSYSDNGYVDVGYVALISNMPMTTADFTNYPADQGCYPAPGGNSDSSGASLLILEVSPLLFQSACPYFNKTTNNKTAQHLQPKTPSNAKTITHTGEIAANTSDPGSVDTAASTTYNQNINKFGANYAQMKFYQARYGDRMGGITSIFNPNWCPGTVGTLFSRGVGDSGKSQGGAGIWLDFFVQSVTHRIALSAPNTGTATTNINFNCGRIGVQTASIEKDLLFDYGIGEVGTAQLAFLKDIQAT